MQGVRGLACLMFLVGCDQVFGLDDVEPVNTLCLGRNTDTGLFDYCLGVQPGADLDGLIDIDTSDDTMCTEVVAQGDVDRTEVCVVAARKIEIHAAVIAHGNRPLVLAAIETFELAESGSISVASHRRLPNGAGATFGRCPGNIIDGGNATGLTNAGAGGAGGSFHTLGGAGGAGSGLGNTHAMPVMEPAPGFIRGGCGAGGGGNARIAAGGGRGAGGGALYIMADSTITIAGTLDASGEGGGSGAGGTAGMSGGAGGGGGGSGGMLGLDAPMITLAATAKLIANGGGGGGGGSSTQPGKNGTEADPTTAFPFAAIGGDGGSMNTGGRGGRGAAEATGALAGADFSGVGGDAGGGGGGGTGYIKTFGELDDQGAAITPAVN